MGSHNSSLTRVRPFFRALLQREPTGLTWLAKLLSVAPNSDEFPFEHPVHDPGTLGPVEVDRERKLHPPIAFLRWLIMNPERMNWPRRMRAGSAQTLRWRKMLMGDDPVARSAAQRDALEELARHGAAGSAKRWWAFEGCTSVDCYLPAERLRIYIEGKRTDVLARSTAWYPHRNQLLRNLEAAQADANGAPFACIVIAEHPFGGVPQSIVDSSLPHLLPAERQQLLRHFLGVITWREACIATDLNYDDLPDTI